MVTEIVTPVIAEVWIFRKSFLSNIRVSGVTDETHVVQVHDAEVEVS